YRNRTPHGHVIVRKFLPCCIRGRINRRPAFIYHHNLDLPGKAETLNERLCLSSGSSVAYRNCLYPEPVAKFPDFPGSLRRALVAEMREDGVVMEQFPLTVKTYEL